MERNHRMRSALEAAAQGTVGADEAVRAIRGAAEDGSAELVPLLREIAENASRDPKRHHLTFEALSAMARHVDDREYLLANARAHASNKWLGYYSILVLGGTPDQWTREALEAIESDDNHIQGAVAEARRVYNLAQSLAAIQSPEDQADFIMKNAAGSGNWNLITQGSGLQRDRLNPQAVWARRVQREFSQKHSKLAARKVFEIDISSMFYPGDSDRTRAKQVSDSYRADVASQLAPEAKAEFDRLVAAETAGSSPRR